MTNYPHLATRLFNTPLAIAPGKIEIIMAALADRFGLARLFRANGEALALDDHFDAGDPAAHAERPTSAKINARPLTAAGTVQLQKHGVLAADCREHAVK
jgi:hypothetical protein